MSVEGLCDKIHDDRDCSNQDYIVKTQNVCIDYAHELPRHLLHCQIKQNSAGNCNDADCDEIRHIQFNHLIHLES